MKKAIVAVSNDLSTDQRVNRTCHSLVHQGYKVLLVGRKKQDSVPMGIRPYTTHRMRLMFQRGPLFYLFFNLRLFLFLFFRRANLIVSNDLDTLWACRWASRMKGVPLWYDTHEIFCEVPELSSSGWKKKVWERLERSIFPKLKYISTVNQSIASYYEKKYGKRLKVIRNIPSITPPAVVKSRKELGMPEKQHILILQGSGINIQRGAEELVDAMKWTEGVMLYIIGSGDVIPELKRRARGLEKKIQFLPKMPFPDLMQYTLNADAGLTLDKDTNLNYRFSLPNKIFDYIRCGIPVIASSLPEIDRVYAEFRIGAQIPSHDPEKIAATIMNFFQEPGSLLIAKAEVKKAMMEYTWEKEERVIVELLNEITAG